MRISLAVLAVVLSGGVAVAASVPIPRPRPAALGQSAKSHAAAEPAAAAEPTDTDEPAAQTGDAAKSDEASHSSGKTEAASAPLPPSTCQLALKAIATFAPHGPVKGTGECGIADPVLLEAVAVPGEAPIPINPPALLRCDMATAVVNWVRTDMVPIAARLGSPLRGIENYDSYECRGRNRVVGAKMSEHGRGNALDVKGLKLESGVIAHLTDAHVARDVRTDLRKSACDRFMTVLGPGSDGYHEEHIHVDLAERSNDYHICQWEVRQPIEREAASPHIASSRSPTPHETMPPSTVISVVVAHATSAGRRAAERRPR